MANSPRPRRWSSPLDDAPLAEDPPFRRPGDPPFEDRVLADQGGTPIAQAESHRRSARSRDGVGRRKDDVERGGQCAAVHASRRALVGHVETGVAEAFGGSAASRTGRANGLKRPTAMSKGMESSSERPTGRTFFGSVRSVAVARRGVGLHPVRHRGQLRRQLGRLVGRGCRAHRQADKAAQLVGEGLRLAPSSPAGQDAVRTDGKGSVSTVARTVPPRADADDIPRVSQAAWVRRRCCPRCRGTRPPGRPTVLSRCRLRPAPSPRSDAC